MSRAKDVPERAPLPCACPGCRNEAPGEGLVYCTACEEEAHAGHCRLCGAVLYSLKGPCPACGMPIGPSRPSGK